MLLKQAVEQNQHDLVQLLLNLDVPYTENELKEMTLTDVKAIYENTRFRKGEVKCDS